MTSSPARRRLTAQSAMELKLTLRRGESLLLTFLIPLGLLVFFTNVDVITIEGDPIDFLTPGVVALAVMSTGLVSTAIATGFERQMGVLKRLGATPLSRPELLGAKVASVLVIELLQVIVLLVAATSLGFDLASTQLAPLVAGVVLATVGFTALGLLMAGTLPALTTLAAANGLYLVLLLLSGMVIPLEELPAAVADASRLLPSTALAEVLRAALGQGSVERQPWLVLGAWAVAAMGAATRFFRWE